MPCPCIFNNYAMKNIMNKFEDAARFLAEKGNAVALTGAGISVDSGIPDFRSTGGIWEKYNPEEYATIYAFRSNPAKVWKFFHEMSEILNNAKPNKAHMILAEMEKNGILKGLVTQNIDNLHQAAGSQKVLEFHGNHKKLRCIKCGKGYSPELFSMSPENDIPLCSCGMVLKPDVILFGEAIDPFVMQESITLAETCSAMLVCGTSGIVYPAAELPFMAKRKGAAIIEMNIDETPITGLADFSFSGSTSGTLPILFECLKPLIEKK
jgi:NAD-dependent deacetylase